MPTRTLFDTEGYDWDLTNTGTYGSAIVQGDFAFNFGMTVSVDGAYLNGTFAADEQGGRQFVITGTLAGLDVARRVYVPNLAGESWGRFLESFTNPTGAAITVRVRLDSNSAADNSTIIVATESGNQLVGTDDDWVITDGPTSPGTTDYVPHVLYLFGDGTRAPDEVTTLVHLASGDQGIGYHYDLTVAPGETVSLLYFISQQRDGAAELQQERRGLSRLDTEALAGLTAAQLGTVVNWNVAAAAREAVINTFAGDLTNFTQPGGGWGDGNGGGYFGQTFIAQGTAIDEIRFHLTEWQNVGGAGGVTDFKVVVTEWVNGRPGAILGSSELLIRSDAEGVSDRRGVYIVTFDNVAVTAGRTYAFMVDANYGTLTTGRGGYEVESNNPYAGGTLFYNAAGTPRDYDNVVVRSGVDLSFRIAFADPAAPPVPPAPPVLANPIADHASLEDRLVTYQIPGDAFSDANEDILTYSATRADGTALPEWLIFVASTRTFSGQPPLHFNGSVAVKVTASDGTGSASDSFDIVIVPVNDQPYVFTEIPDQSGGAGTPFSFTFAVDAFADHELTPLIYTATLAGGEQLPAWLAFDGATRTFSGIVPAAADGTLTIVVRASDGSLSVTDAFNLALVPNAPSVARADAFTVAENGAISGDLRLNNGSGADSDPDSPLEAVTRINGATFTPGAAITLASGALLTVQSDGTFVYDTNLRFTSLAGGQQATDTFTYSLANGGTATVTVVVNGIDNENRITGSTGDDTLNGTGGPDVLVGGLGADAMNGGDGIDTVSYDDNYGAVTLDLRVGRGYTNAAFGDTYTSIENVRGSSFGDYIIGGYDNNKLEGLGGDDVLVGSLGADVLDGGDGIDFASYEDNQGAVFIDLYGNGGYGNAAQGDTYVSIENLRGSIFNDYLIGDGNANRLEGIGGDDVLIGGLGGDVLVGGDGIDTASYEENWGAVTADLNLGQGFGNAAQGDTYQGIENARGGMFADTLIGDGGANRLMGGLGNDTLVGNGGADVFVMDSALNATTNVDLLLDFASGVDRIELKASVFTGIATGTLTSAAFGLGTTATTADQRILYDGATGNLYFDADGIGGTAAVMFATLTTKPMVAATDFLVAV